MALTRQTEEQMRASDPLSSVWVGASAGTGKTFVLTNRVLRLMLAGTTPDKILCLTFTKAAATEMSNRVNDKLASWVLTPDEMLFTELEVLLGHKPGKDHMERARILFAEVLDVPGGLQIQTIHAFCQSLLGRFPIEANITPHFQVMDERTASEYIRNAQDDVFRYIQKGDDKKLVAALSHISNRETENTFAELMVELNGERGGIDRLKKRFLDIRFVMAAMREMLDLSENESSVSVLEFISQDTQFDLSGLKYAASVLCQGLKTDEKKGLIISDWLNDPERRVEKYTNYKSAFLTAKGDLFAKYMTKGLAEKHPDVLDILLKEVERIQYVEARLKSISLIENSEAMLHVGLALIEAYGQQKSRHSVLDYDDLILKVRGLFGQNNMAEWILYKLDGGLDHILIDEAQDTNPDQWQVIRTLAGEFFTGIGTRNEDDYLEKPRTIFAVGDVKQSIYSFQKANPKEFVENNGYFNERVNDAKLTFDEVPMNLSFRSTSAVLDVVDETFKSDESRKAISFSLNEIRHDTHRKGHGGLVEIWDTEIPDHEDEEEDWTPPVIQKAANDPSMKIAERIADQIDSWLKNGEKLVSQNRAINAGDILILVRHRNIFVQYMISALKKRNINVAGQDRMVLTDQLAVMDLIAVAKFTLLPSDDLNLAVVLKSPFIGFDEKDLFDLAHYRKKNESLWSSLLRRKDERKIFNDAATYLTSLTNYADFVPPFEFFSYLMGPMKGREKILSRLGEQANDPMDEFMSLTMSYEQNNISSMQGFLNWIESGDKEIKRDMEQSGEMVRIMTVHGAKGLQAPIVFLPDTCQTPRVRQKLYWSDKYLFWVKNKDAAVGRVKEAYDESQRIALEEYERLLYVAMTRAEDRLYVTGWEGKKGRSDGCWYDMIHKALETMDNVQEIKNDENVILRREIKQSVEVAERKVEITDLATVIALPTWAQELPPEEPRPSKPLTPSRPDEDEEAVTSPLKLMDRRNLDQRRYHRGRLLHKLLELLPELPMADREAAARRFLSQDIHEMTETDLNKSVDEVMAIITDEEFSDLFGPYSRSEVPIVGQIGTYALSGMVDRLVVLENEIMVVDYKTNRPPPKDAEHVPTIYLRQMAAYKHVLKDIYPDHKIRSLLLWTDIGSLMELPEEKLDKIKF